MPRKPSSGYDWLHAAMGQDEIFIPHTCVAVMAHIAHMGGGNKRTISVNGIAAKRGWDRGAVQRAVKKLVENKFLIDPEPGPGRTTKYTLNIPFDTEGN
jgi:hypothetical protein